MKQASMVIGAYTSAKAVIKFIQGKKNSKPITELNTFFQSYKNKNILEKYGLKSPPFVAQESGYALSDCVFGGEKDFTHLLESIDKKLSRGGLQRVEFMSIIRDGVLGSINRYIKYKKGRTFNGTNYEVPFLHYFKYIINLIVMSFCGDAEDELEFMDFLADYLQKFSLLDKDGTRCKHLKPCLESIGAARRILKVMVDNNAYKVGFDKASRDAADTSNALYRLGVTLALKSPSYRQLGWLIFTKEDGDNPYYSRANLFSKKRSGLQSVNSESEDDDKSTLLKKRKKRAQKFIGNDVLYNLREEQSFNFKSKKKLTHSEKVLQAELIDEILDCQEFDYDTSKILEKLSLIIAMSPQTLIMNEENGKRTKTFLESILKRREGLFQTKQYRFLKENAFNKKQKSEKIISSEVLDILNSLELQFEESQKSIRAVITKITSKSYKENFKIQVTEEIEVLNRLSKEFCKKNGFEDKFYINNEEDLKAIYIKKGVIAKNKLGDLTTHIINKSKYLLENHFKNHNSYKIILESCSQIETKTNEDVWDVENIFNLLVAHEAYLNALFEEKQDTVLKEALRYCHNFFMVLSSINFEKEMSTVDTEKVHLKEENFRLNKDNRQLLDFKKEVVEKVEKLNREIPELCLDFEASEPQNLNVNSVSHLRDYNKNRDQNLSEPLVGNKSKVSQTVHEPLETNLFIKKEFNIDSHIAEIRRNIIFLTDQLKLKDKDFNAFLTQLNNKQKANIEAQIKLKESNDQKQIIIDSMKNKFTGFSDEQEKKLKSHIEKIQNLNSSFTDLERDLCSLNDMKIQDISDSAKLINLEKKLKVSLEKAKKIKKQIDALSNDTQAMHQHLMEFREGMAIEFDSLSNSIKDIDNKLELLNNASKSFFEKASEIKSKISSQKSSISKNKSFVLKFLSMQCEQVNVGGEPIMLQCLDSMQLKGSIIKVPKHIKLMIDSNLDKIKENYNLNSEEYKKFFASLLIRASKTAATSMSIFRSKKMSMRYTEWSKIEQSDIDITKISCFN